MKRHLANLLLISGLILFASACDSNSGNDGIDPTDSGSIAGTYDLISMTDKTGDLFGSGNRTIPAGEATTITMTEGGQTFTATVLLDGSMIFTSARYTMNLSIAITIPGFGSNTDVSTDTGTYTLSGNRMTISSDNPEEGEGPDEVTLSADGNRLTLEDPEFSMVLQKR